jgi:hypothetical protein
LVLVELANPLHLQVMVILEMTQSFQQLRLMVAVMAEQTLVDQTHLLVVVVDQQLV